MDFSIKLIKPAESIGVYLTLENMKHQYMTLRKVSCITVSLHSQGKPLRHSKQIQKYYWKLYFGFWVFRVWFRLGNICKNMKRTNNNQLKQTRELLHFFATIQRQFASDINLFLPFSLHI